MKKAVFFAMLIAISFCVTAQSGDIVIGKIDTLTSTVLNEQRKIWVYVPESADENLYAKEKYPVVYLLDGDAHFYPTVGMVHQLSTVNGNTVSPKMIVVGIPNTNRMRDLTPSKPKPGDDPLMPPAMVKYAGGGENFLKFIEKELIPYIDANYPTEPFRMFIGHSLGGLMVMHTFLEKPELFNAYVSIDPSMSWHKQQLLSAIKKADFGEGYDDKTLFMGFANTLPEGMDTAMVKSQPSSPMTDIIRSILELNAHINKQNGSMNYQGKYYPDDDHGSVPFIAGYDALRFIFQNHRLTIGPSDVMNPNSDLSSKIKDHYQQLSEFYGYQKRPEESFLNTMGYQLMQMQMLDKSEDLFLLNTYFYPDRFNVYDSLGDLYVAKGDKEKAIESFEKALELNAESTLTKEKLTKLQKD
jgi:predicted alpha/beta superfamily hydrolase